VIIEIGNIDFKLLRDQKALLLSRITDNDPLMGLVHLIDHLQDRCAEDVGCLEVFGFEPH
jgi:hypothetical protein